MGAKVAGAGAGALLSAPWLKTLETGLTAAPAVAALVGPAGLGPVQEQEMAVALSQARGQGKRVILAWAYIEAANFAVRYNPAI